ncbi:MAG: hypothetical protein KatS3mg033_0225 [Thermonema sp.]|uniref:GLPGLI family protein n=1 Tax=Thermonema sp. TaxID=2231181 RepID=UPI0021DDF5D2|nr:GLPGLI family protein [Thermonema sp.]GIV38425.1 MAG: hypothetical protein KatS3mg033_0225 [Thermonema sp.]
MKKCIYYLLLCFVCLSSYHAAAQTNKGSTEGLHIVYSYAPHFFSKPSEVHAYFSGAMNLFQEYKPLRVYTPEGAEGGRARVTEKESFQKVCIDYLKKEITYERAFKDSSKIYTKEPFMDLRWEFTGRKKEVLGYPCQEAVLTKAEVKRHPLLAYDDIPEYHFWYTTAIPAKDGYLFFTGLPGAVLQIEYPDPSSGELHRMLEAKKVEKQPFPAAVCQSLTEGLRVASIQEAYYWNFYQKYIGKSKKKKK